MQWLEHANIMVRHLINDTDSSNYKYSDDRINTTVSVAAQIVSLELDFNAQYAVDIVCQRITPDPSSDSAFINCMAYKAAVVILGGEIRAEAGNAISIKDGPSAIDLRGVSSTLFGLYKDISEKYENMLMIYGYAGGTGKAILGPYSPGSDYITRMHTENTNFTNDNNFR